MKPKWRMEAGGEEEGETLALFFPYTVDFNSIVAILVEY